MSGNPYESPGTTGKSSTLGFERLARSLFNLLVAVGVIGIVIALLLPARRTARESGRRAQCTNNLKQIALALHLYEQTYHALPPAHTVDAAGQPLHSWRTLILPFLEQKDLYDRIDQTKAWDDPANQSVYETPLSAYQCPSIDVPLNHTTYVAVAAPGGCLIPSISRQLSEITDPHSETLMVIELDAGRHVHWMSPTDANEQTILTLLESEGLPHQGGVTVAYVDGHVTFLKSDTTEATLRALISVAGNDDANSLEPY